jgi:hypothetical protein
MADPRVSLFLIQQLHGAQQGTQMINGDKECSQCMKASRWGRHANSNGQSLLSTSRVRIFGLLMCLVILGRATAIGVMRGGRIVADIPRQYATEESIMTAATEQAMDSVVATA